MSRARPNAFSFPVRRCSIALPHLNYTIRVRPIKTAPVDDPVKAYVERENRHAATMYLPNPCGASMAAHEVLHVIQFLFRDRHIEFLDETEHSGYIMQYVLGTIMGLTWVRVAKRKTRR